MGRYDVRTDTERFAELREALAALQALTEQPEVNLVAIGKAYQRVATTLRAATTEHGPPSMRFAAVEKALDLTTPKSAIEAFLGEP